MPFLFQFSKTKWERDFQKVTIRNSSEIAKVLINAPFAVKTFCFLLLRTAFKLFPIILKYNFEVFPRIHHFIYYAYSCKIFSWYEVSSVYILTYRTKLVKTYFTVMLGFYLEGRGLNWLEFSHFFLRYCMRVLMSIFCWNNQNVYILLHLQVRELIYD